MCKIILYLLLGNFPYPHIVVNGGHCGDFLLRVVVFRRYPPYQFGTPGSICTVESVDEHICLFVAKYVAADGLSEHGRVAVNVKIIVLQLEGKPHLLAELVQIICVFIRRTAQNCAYLKRTCKQNTCLQAYHFDVFVFRYIGTCLEIHVILLPFSYFKSCLREKVKHLFQLARTAVKKMTVRQYKHTVTRKDCRIVVPLHMYGLLSAPHVGVVHEVVVQQCIVMVCLDGARRRQYALRVVLIHVVSHEHQ